MRAQLDELLEDRDPDLSLCDLTREVMGHDPLTPSFEAAYPGLHDDPRTDHGGFDRTAYPGQKLTAESASGERIC